MVFIDLPPEIQSRILELCSPSDLAILSRVHTSGRDIAEHILYSRIQYRIWPPDVILISSRNVENDESLLELREAGSLLHTVADNSWKASMVKMFHVELDDEDELWGSESDENFWSHDYLTRIKLTNFILVKLSEAIVKMSNLVDLRILHSQMRIYDLDVFKGTRRISEVIRYIFRSGNDGN